MSGLSALAAKCIHFIDLLFYRMGYTLALHPWKSLTLSLVLCLVCGSGLLRWNDEASDAELFLTPGSDMRNNADWVDRNFVDELRFESVIVEADNIFQCDVLRAIAELQIAVESMNVSGKQLKDVCATYLSWLESAGGNLSSLQSWLEMSEMKLPNECLFQSILKLWSKDNELGNEFCSDNESILEKITEALVNRDSFNILNDVTPLLSGVKWNNNRTKALAAKATILNWMLKKNDSSTPAWELDFIQQTIFSNRSLPEGVNVYGIASRSYDDFLYQVLENNKTLMFAGFSLIIFYVIIMTGKFNLVEQRILLALLGVSVIGQAIFASYGLCFYMGFFWGPLHPVLPFLLLGIGVDNIFVIMQCLENLNDNDKKLSVPERIGKVLQQCGISITVTILTDIFAFAVGTTTIMPFLQSFCTFAAVGIFCVYIFMFAFFVSCLAIDEGRVYETKDCIFRKLYNWKANDCSNRSLQQIIFSKYVAPTLMKRPVKVLVLLVTILLFCVNVWCTFKVEQKFDPVWYLNQGSYPIKFNNKLTEHFPEYGKRGGIYLIDVNYFDEKKSLYELANQLQSNFYINNATLDIWYKKFDAFIEQKDYRVEDNENYNNYLIEFLLIKPEGQAYIKDFKFDNFPNSEYTIASSIIPIQHIMMNTTAEQGKAMDSINEIVSSIKFNSSTAKIFAYSPDYIPWIANKVIGEELIRNLAIIFGAVCLVTVCLIQNIHSVIWVNCCVIFTVVDLVGSMYWMGLTIEISTSLMILLCAGLAVDYAAHIGNEFTRLYGTRDERATAAISNIGPAVFNGGSSTFLAFSLLGTSESYLFTTFFKLFTGVVVFGLLHGLIFLPVILSLLGPSSKPVKGKAVVCSVQMNGHQLVISDGVNQSYLMPTPVCADDCCENTEDNYERNNHTVKEQNSISDKI